MKIIVVGAGAWGTALACCAARSKDSHDVSLLARDAAQAEQMQASRSNGRYLPDVAFPESLKILAGDAREAASMRADLYLIATPMAGLSNSLQAFSQTPKPVAWICKGFDGNGLLAHEIAAQSAPDLGANRLFGVLSGPSFALEVARGQPTALVAASEHAAVSQALVAAFHSERLRVYESSDVVGVEVGGAVKNVLAIATGLCDGLDHGQGLGRGLGLNARAALITRGLAEMTRLGVALGARAETFMGLSGLGDLVLTAIGDLSRNRRVGLLLAQGKSLDQIMASLGSVAEGARCAQAVLSRATQLGVDMPITQCVVLLLAGKIDANQAVGMLMGREPGRESAS